MSDASIPDPAWFTGSATAPSEPSAAIRKMASTLHQVFIALTGEGFTEQQALQVIGVMLVANVQGGR